MIVLVISLLWLSTACPWPTTITKDFDLRGYRAASDSNGDLVTLLPGVDTTKLSNKPIQADERCRPIITINAQMPGPTIIAHKGQTLNIIVYN